MTNTFYVLRRVSLVPFINYNYNLDNAELKLVAKVLKNLYNYIIDEQNFQ